MICYVDYCLAAKFKRTILQPSNTDTKKGVMQSWKQKVEPDLGCRSNNISYISVFDLSWYSQDWLGYGLLIAKVA